VVGKTTVAVNLPPRCPRAKEVMLLDGDLGLANVDVFGPHAAPDLADVLPALARRRSGA
jgi:MinD-like ATPase involved in chromosome partitioning or flagellar assembly